MPAEPVTTLSIMALYSAGVRERSQGNVEPFIDHYVATANEIFENSGLSIQLRLVHTQYIATNDTDASDVVLKRMTNERNEFAGIHNLRAEHKADLVVMMRPYAGDGRCGCAWAAGIDTQGDLSLESERMYSHISVTSCGSYVLAHEIGHNMGLRHSRRQNPAGGTFSYSTGYGVDGNFVTIMAYGSAFSFAPKTLLFSALQG